MSKELTECFNPEEEWEFWPESLHFNTGQLKRISSAIDIPKKKYKFVSPGKANFTGSSGGLYETTLKTCTCKERLI